MNWFEIWYFNFNSIEFKDQISTIEPNPQMNSVIVVF